MGNGTVTRSEESIIRMTLNVPLTTPADPSLALRMTSNILCHYDA